MFLLEVYSGKIVIFKFSRSLDSHQEASVECDFSVSKSLLVENLLKESFVSHCIVFYMII